MATFSYFPCLILLLILFLIQGPNPSLGISCHVCAGWIIAEVVDDHGYNSRALPGSGQLAIKGRALTPEQQRYNRLLQESCEDGNLDNGQKVNCDDIDEDLDRCVTARRRDNPHVHGRSCHNFEFNIGHWTRLSVCKDKDFCNRPNIWNPPPTTPAPAPGDPPKPEPEPAKPEPEEPKVNTSNPLRNGQNLSPASKRGFLGFPNANSSAIPLGRGREGGPLPIILMTAGFLRAITIFLSL